MVDFETEKQYNEIVATIMRNVYAERDHVGKILLWDFQESQSMDRLYFNVASIVADMTKEKMYVQMPLIDYLKLKWRRKKGRKSLRWCGPLMARRLPNEAKTSIYILMEFIREYHDIPYETFEDIQNEFYNWV